RRLVEVELDALDDAAELLDLLRTLVGAAVGILELVVGLGLLRALILGIEDAVTVGVRRRAPVGLIAPGVGALVAFVADAVAIAVRGASVVTVTGDVRARV